MGLWAGQVGSRADIKPIRLISIGRIWYRAFVGSIVVLARRTCSIGVALRPSMLYPTGWGSVSGY